MNEGSRRFAEAMRCLDAGKAEEALQIGNELAASADEADKISGYLCLAYVYEDAAKSDERKFELALHYFRNVSLLVDDVEALCNVARVLFKMGRFDDCIDFLRRAEAVQSSAVVLLGFAHYYRCKPNPDLVISKHYYFRAGIHGRFAGFFGYSDVARELGQHGRAVLVSTLRIAFGWLIAMAIGDRALQRFI